MSDISRFETEMAEENNLGVDMVNKPQHYIGGALETIQKIDVVLDGLTGKEAYYLGNILKYFDRAGLKDDAMQDLQKASNYAHRLVTGTWKYE